MITTNEHDQITQIVFQLRTKLENALYKVQQHIAMDINHFEHQNADFGLAKSRTFSLLSLTNGDYTSVGSTLDDKAIVVYRLAKDIGFGLFDEDTSVCLPIDLDELIDEIMEIPSGMVRDFMIQMMFTDLDKLVAI